MSEHQRRARSFGGVADAYDRGRPDYPAAAVRWLVGTTPLRVLELGAGTGKLTQALVAAGHDVHATEPDEAMLAHLRRHLPDVRATATGAEEVPADDAAYDVVVAAQCAHWFSEPAWAEIARVLRDGGVLATVWNTRDERIPWVRRLGRIIGTQENLGAMDAVAASGFFGEPEAQTFGHWQGVDRRTIQDLVLSRSNVAVLDEAERERVLAGLLALYDDYGRGMDGMQVPYRTECFRAPLIARPAPEPEPAEDADAERDAAEAEPTVPLVAPEPRRDPVRDSAATLPRVVTGLDDDAGLMLIDFH